MSRQDNGQHHRSDIIDVFIGEGAKQFSSFDPTDRNIAGKLNGRSDLLTYGKYIDRSFHVFMHIERIAEKLVLFEQRKIRRLIINMPPQHGSRL